MSLATLFHSSLLFLSVTSCSATIHRLNSLNSGILRPTDSVRVPAPGALTDLRVLSYNIQTGRVKDGRIDLERIANVIRNSQADVIALQEVDRGTGRSGGIDEIKELSRLTGFNWRFGKAIDWDGGAFGEAVLSRLPLGKAHSYRLSALPEHESREALAVPLEIPGQAPIRFISTHLDHTEGHQDRIKQAKQLAALLDDGYPTVLAGDMNSGPRDEEMMLLENSFNRAGGDKLFRTWPSTQPDLSIDHVFYRHLDGWNVQDVQVLQEPDASDHDPLLVTFSRVPVSHL